MQLDIQVYVDRPTVGTRNFATVERVELHIKNSLIDELMFCKVLE